MAIMKYIRVHFKRGRGADHQSQLKGMWTLEHKVQSIPCTKHKT
jgi:hypothetical protein